MEGGGTATGPRASPLCESAPPNPAASPEAWLAVHAMHWAVSTGKWRARQCADRSGDFGVPRTATEIRGDSTSRHHKRNELHVPSGFEFNGKSAHNHIDVYWDGQWPWNIKINEFMRHHTDQLHHHTSIIATAAPITRADAHLLLPFSHFLFEILGVTRRCVLHDQDMIR